MHMWGCVLTHDYENRWTYHELDFDTHTITPTD